MTFLKNKAKSFLLFFIILTISILVYTLLLHNQVISSSKNSVFITTFIIGIFLFLILGIISGLFEQKKGWLAGLTSGIILLIIVIIFKLCNKELDNPFLIVKYLSFLTSSILGGILGINFKGRKSTHLWFQFDMISSHLRLFGIILWLRQQ